MLKSFIVVQKNFNFPDIEIEVLADQSWSVDEKYIKRVADCWEEKQKHAREHNVHIWDGTHYRIENLEELSESKEKITLRLGTIAYRYIATFGDLKHTLAEKTIEGPRHLATGAIIRTSDNLYFFGKRSYNGKIDLIGGGVQPDEIVVTCGSDLEKNLRKEMEEEAGIQDIHIEHLEGVGILHSTSSNVVIISLVHLRVSRKEMQEIFNTRTDDEMSELVFVDEANLCSFLEAMDTYRPFIPTLLKK